MSRLIDSPAAYIDWLFRNCLEIACIEYQKFAASLRVHAPPTVYFEAATWVYSEIAGSLPPDGSPENEGLVLSVVADACCSDMCPNIKPGDSLMDPLMARSLFFMNFSKYCRESCDGMLDYWTNMGAVALQQMLCQHDVKVIDVRMGPVAFQSSGLWDLAGEIFRMGPAKMTQLDDPTWEALCRGFLDRIIFLIPPTVEAMKALCDMPALDNPAEMDRVAARVRDEERQMIRDAIEAKWPIADR